jgi:hypothetical protein
MFVPERIPELESRYKGGTPRKLASMSLADKIGRGGPDVNPDIKRVAYDDSLSPECRIHRLEQMSEGASGADLAQTEGYIEMLTRLEVDRVDEIL